MAKKTRCKTRWTLESDTAGKWEKEFSGFDKRGMTNALRAFRRRFAGHGRFQLTPKKVCK